MDSADKRWIIETEMIIGEDAMHIAAIRREIEFRELELKFLTGKLDYNEGIMKQRSEAVVLFKAERAENK